MTRFTLTYYNLDTLLLLNSVNNRNVYAVIDLIF